MSRRQPTSRSRTSRGSVRIIGGHWRGRRISIAGGADLRPTPDRVRETLFNWLAPAMAGARCLDLYAGTGVLGLEALSRGAASSWFVERDSVAVAALEKNLQVLFAPDSKPDARQADSRVLQADALRWLAGAPMATFDIVFLDPPYAAGKLAELCTLLARGWLAPQAFVYLESSRSQPLPALPDAWQVHREAEAGDVRYALVTVRRS